MKSLFFLGMISFLQQAQDVDGDGRFSKTLPKKWRARKEKVHHAKPRSMSASELYCEPCDRYCKDIEDLRRHIHTPTHIEAVKADSEDMDR